MILVTCELRIVVSSAQLPDHSLSDYSMQREDTDPWYRQFWPWFIMALPASAVVAGLYTVWIAMQTTDSLVVRSDDGMTVVTERNMAAEREANRLGLHALVDINPETGAIIVTLSSAANVDLPKSLALQMRHPTMASRDASIELLRAMPNSSGEATWAGHFLTPPSGRHFVILSSDNTWRLSAEWSGQPQFQLDPAGQSDNGQH
jgi:hypothetical protein